MANVVALTGNVNGSLVIFSRDPSGTWKANVPRVRSGLYLIQLMARDEAGNDGFYATALCRVNDFGISVRILPPNYTFSEEELRLLAQTDGSEFSFIPETTPFDYAPLMAKFAYRELTDDDYKDR